MSSSNSIVVVTTSSELLLDKDAEAAAVSEMESLFHDRFSENDAEFIKSKDEITSPPPCLENWGMQSQRQNNWQRNRGSYRGGNPRYDDGNRNWNRNHHGNYDNRNYDNRNYGNRNYDNSGYYGNRDDYRDRHRHPQDRYRPYPQR